jgi:transketolase
MRKEFAATIANLMAHDPACLFLTGDLGFMALESVREALGPRFINAGVAEQNMIGMAAGLASEGLKPLCYSIAPFAVFRPAEQIRLDVCLHNMNVKIVGNGGGYGYGIMGSTHHAIEDLAVLSSFQNMRCFVPWCNQDVPSAVAALMDRVGPSYLRLGFGIAPTGTISGEWAAVRQVRSGGSLTVVGMGPVILNALAALESTGVKSSVFVVSELPLSDIGDAMRQSLRATGRCVILEEHVARGGLAETMALQLLREGLCPKLRAVSASGYPGGLYGSQAYHVRMSGLDPESLGKTFLELVNE